MGKGEGRRGEVGGGGRERWEGGRRKGGGGKMKGGGGRRRGEGGGMDKIEEDYQLYRRHRYPSKDPSMWSKAHIQRKEEDCNRHQPCRWH